MGASHHFVSRPEPALPQRAFVAASLWSWQITGLLAAATLGLAVALHVPFEAKQVPLNVVVAAIFAPVALFYAHKRYDARVAGFCDSVALLSSYTLIAAIGTYVATAAGARGPLWDERFLHVDQTLGLDWRAYLAWLDQSPRLGRWLDASYRSALVQVGAVIVVLGALGLTRRLQTFVLALQVSLLVCVVAPAFVPALGAYTFLHIVPAIDHPHIPLTSMNGSEAQILQLRGPTPLIRVDDIEGVVVCPSFHTVLAILFAWSFWPVRGLRWGALLLNGCMLAATPLSGDHYFIDIGAGAVLALASLLVARALVRRCGRVNRSATAGLPLPAPLAAT